MSPERRLTRWWTAGAGRVVPLLFVVGCALAGESAPPASVPESNSSAAATPVARATATASTEPAESVSAHVPLPLTRFYAALHELAQHKRDRHVRVLWLGDSHTAADFMTDAVRAPLQQRFGVGGPGFVRLGVKHYRHAAARVVARGEWRKIPAEPSATRQHAGAVFGLGGMGATPRG